MISIIKYHGSDQDEMVYYISDRIKRDRNTLVRIGKSSELVPEIKKKCKNDLPFVDFKATFLGIGVKSDREEDQYLNTQYFFQDLI